MAAAAVNFRGGKVERNQVHIKVLGCENLPAADSNGKSDPYVVVKDVKGLIGEGGKTKVVKKTLNPDWRGDASATFRFEANYKILALKFACYDWDRFSSDDLLGKCYVPVSALFDGQPHEFRYPLHKKKHGAAERGTLVVECQMVWNFPIAIPGWWMSINPAEVPSVCVGLGWDFSRGKEVDLDASALLLREDNSVEDAVHFSKLVSDSGAVRHSGDNRTGEGDGDDEVINVALQQVPASIAKIAVVVNAYDAGKTFSMVKTAYVRLFIPGGNTIAFWRLDANQSQQQGLFLGYLVRVGLGWSYTTVGREVSGNTATASTPAVQEIIRSLTPQ